MGLGYCGSCIEFEECRCKKLDIVCKAGKKACMYFRKKD